jgi:hypothetical protein
VSGLEWVGRERRAEERLRLLGENAVCVVCGERERAALKKAGRRLIEFHHLAGEANDPELGVFLCLTHHRILTEQMRDAGVQLDDDPERVFLERLREVLVGIGLALVAIGEALLRWAQDLGAEVGRLDREAQGWRGAAFEG